MTWCSARLADLYPNELVTRHKDSFVSPGARNRSGCVDMSMVGEVVGNTLMGAVVGESVVDEAFGASLIRGAVGEA